MLLPFFLKGVNWHSRASRLIIYKECDSDELGE